MGVDFDELCQGTPPRKDDPSGAQQNEPPAGSRWLVTLYPSEGEEVINSVLTRLIE